MSKNTLQSSPPLLASPNLHPRGGVWSPGDNVISIGKENQDQGQQLLSVIIDKKRTKAIKGSHGEFLEGSGDYRGCQRSTDAIIFRV